GLIIISFAGTCKGTYGVKVKVADEKQAEALGAMKAVLWEKEMNIIHLHLKGDNLNVVSAIKRKEEVVK
ncbi:hypothetical protein MKX01_040875, partial [Papaver californicum]